MLAFTTYQRLFSLSLPSLDPHLSHFHSYPLTQTATESWKPNPATPIFLLSGLLILFFWRGKQSGFHYSLSQNYHLIKGICGENKGQKTFWCIPAKWHLGEICRCTQLIKFQFLSVLNTLQSRNYVTCLPVNLWHQKLQQSNYPQIAWEKLHPFTAARPALEAGFTCGVKRQWNAVCPRLIALYEQHFIPEPAFKVDSHQAHLEQFIKTSRARYTNAAYTHKHTYSIFYTEISIYTKEGAVRMRVPCDFTPCTHTHSFLLMQAGAEVVENNMKVGICATLFL